MDFKAYLVLAIFLISGADKRPLREQFSRAIRRAGSSVAATRELVRKKQVDQCRRDLVMFGNVRSEQRLNTRLVSAERGAQG